MIIELYYMKILLSLFLIIFSILISYLGNSGLFGTKLKKILSYNSLSELIFVTVLVSCFFMFLANFLFLIHNYLFNLNNLGLSIIDKNAPSAQDPIRFWPSGTPQTWGIIGTAALVYRGTPGNTKIKTFAALSSLGITIPLNVYFHAVENPNGFNRLMYSWTTHRQTGKWPVNIPEVVSDSAIQTAIDASAAEATAAVETLNNTNNFLPDSNILSQFTPENLFLNLAGLFKPVGVQGHLDDLIGQQLFIHFLLIFVVISLIILFSIYILIQTMFNNKEFIQKKFNNKFITLYLKYQIFLAKVSLFLLPLLIMLGLIELFVGLYFIITHPIPYEVLPIDLHTYVNNKNK